MLVHIPIAVTLRFAVGKKYCVAKIQFEKGDDTNEVLSKFFQQENIPAYLETTIMSSVHSLFVDLRKSAEVQSEAVLNIDESISSSQLLALQYKLTSTQWKEPDLSITLQGASEQAFSSAYRLMRKDEKWRKNLQQLELTYSLAMRQLVNSRDENLESLRKRHSEEMEKESRAGSTRIPELVIKHIQEMESLENKWETEILNVKSIQQQEFQDFVIGFAKNGKEFSVGQGTPELGNSRQEEKEINSPSETRGKPPGVIDTIPIYLGAQLKTLYHINLYGNEILDLCLPAEPKNGKSGIPGSVKKSPYSGYLSGIILMTDPNLSFMNKDGSRFLKLCHMSTEFHFSGIQEQLDEIKKQLVSESNGVGNNINGHVEFRHNNNNNNKVVVLQAGDFVITRHSNLENVSVVFHFVMEKKNNNAILVRLQQGLRNLLHVASRNDIEILTIPVALIPREDKHLFSDVQYLRHSESVLKTVRTFLLENSNSRYNSIKTVQFGMPKQDDPLFGSILSLVDQINR